MVVYLRVSTAEQANNPQNLPNQENVCLRHCERNGYNVVRVFIDPGESGRVAEGPEWQEMKRFCREHSHEVEYVIVQDTSRFARNLRAQSDFIADLWSNGIKFRSVHEPNINETAAGKLALNIHGAFNQHFSDSHSERMKERTYSNVLAGRWPWLAPPGYNNLQSKAGANIAPDAEQEPLLRRCFELMSQGIYGQTDVLRMMTEAGLRDRKGRPFTKQYLNRILRSPVYAGWVCPPSMPNVKVKGLHRPIVSQELFDAVQRVLDGKRPITAPKRKINPAFPLRGLVRCAACEKPLTAAMCRSRSGKRYGYYYCRQNGCRAVKSVQTQMLEGQFLELLSSLRPQQPMSKDFPKIVAEVCRVRMQESFKRARLLASQIESSRKMKDELLRAKLKGEVPQEDYVRGNAILAAEISGLETQLRETSSTQSRAEDFQRFAQLANTDLADLWQKAEPEQRIRVRQILFSDGLLLHPNSGLSNQNKSSLFSVLMSVKGQNRGQNEIGSSGRTRTYNPPVNSRMLCH